MSVSTSSHVGPESLQPVPRPVLPPARLQLVSFLWSASSLYRPVFSLLQPADRQELPLQWPRGALTGQENSCTALSAPLTALLSQQDALCAASIQRTESLSRQTEHEQVLSDLKKRSAALLEIVCVISINCNCFVMLFTDCCCDVT